MNIVIEWHGHKIALGDDADFQYRSHINGMQCTEPDNWVHVTGYDMNEEETYYDIWYYVEDTSIDLDQIDYSDPWNVMMRL